jgi:hypothetical protein
VVEHALQVGRVLLDVDVFEPDVPPGVLLTGGFGIGSGVFAEDQHGHMRDLSSPVTFVKYFT